MCVCVWHEIVEKWKLEKLFAAYERTATQTNTQTQTCTQDQSSNNNKRNTIPFEAVLGWQSCQTCMLHTQAWRKVLWISLRFLNVFRWYWSSVALSCHTPCMCLCIESICVMYGVYRRVRIVSHFSATLSHCFWLYLTFIHIHSISFHSPNDHAYCIRMFESCSTQINRASFKHCSRFCCCLAAHVG